MKVDRHITIIVFCFHYLCPSYSGAATNYNCRLMLRNI